MLFRRTALLLLALPLLLECALGAGRVLKARVEEPVLEELMGGCSMKCGLVWSVTLLGGKSARTVKTLNDERAETAWVADGPGGGVGARLRLAFPKKIPAEMEGEVPFYGLDLINGYWKTEELWRQHARVKRARLLYNERPLGEVVFADSRRWQRVEFDDVMVRSGDALVFEVLEIYPGENAPLALSEIVLQGAH